MASSSHSYRQASSPWSSWMSGFLKGWDKTPTSTECKHKKLQNPQTFAQTGSHICCPVSQRANSYPFPPSAPPPTPSHTQKMQIWLTFSQWGGFTRSHIFFSNYKPVSSKTKLSFRMVFEDYLERQVLQDYFYPVMNNKISFCIHIGVKTKYLSSPSPKNNTPQMSY